MTPEREAVLETFINAEKMLTPSQLHQMVLQQTDYVGLTTVYRLLEVLTKLQLATPFLQDGEIFYTFCTGQHHHHFVCLECKRVQDVFECPTIQNVSQYGTISSHKLDLFGRCVNCEEAAREEGSRPC